MVIRTLVVLAHTAFCELAGGDVAVHFRSSDGSTVTRKYSRDRAVFEESRYLRTRLEERRSEARTDEMEHVVAEVELACAPEVFEAAAQLIDAPLDSKVSADVAFCTLGLAEVLDLRDGKKKEMFYRGVARATADSDRLAHEIEQRMSYSGIGKYILEALRERAGAYVVVRNAEGCRETLCTASMPVEAIDEIIVQKAAMRKKILGILRWLADVADLRGLCLSGCKLDEGAVESLGAMKSLRRLDMFRCKVAPGGLRHIQGLENLEELDVSWVELSAEDVSTISRLARLTKLDVRHCSLGPGTIGRLGALRCLRELSVSFNMLSEDDLSKIGGIDELRKLKISRYHRMASESLKSMQGPKNLSELEIMGKDLNGDDMLGIMAMRSLEKLALIGCWIEPGCLMRLHELENLRELRVLWTSFKFKLKKFTLCESDLLEVCRIKNLEKLLLHEHCKIKVGSLKHVGQMECLKELHVSSNRLSAEDLSGIGRAKELRTLRLRSCSVAANDFELLHELKNLNVLDITGIKVSGSKETFYQSLDKLCKKGVAVVGREHV